MGQHNLFNPTRQFCYMEFETLNITKDGNLGKVILDSGTERNAMTSTMFSELRYAFEHFRFAEDIRCILLTGEGEYFSVGAELKGTKDKLDVSDAERRSIVHTDQENLHNAMLHIREAPKPVIAGVNGPAAGGGLGIAIACDITYISDDAFMSYAFSRIGLSDAATTYFLPRLLGFKEAFHFAIRSPRVDAEDSVSMGLANEVLDSSDFDTKVTNIAREVANGPTIAFGYTKELMSRSFDRPLRTHLGEEEKAILEEVVTQDFEEGLRAFIEQREPEFEGK